MPWWGWVSLIAALIGIGWAIDAWILPRLRGEPQELDTRISSIEAKVGRIAEYIDGLTGALFEKAFALYKASKYREAIQAFEACFQQATTAHQRAALHGLIGNCFLGLSKLGRQRGITEKQRKQQKKRRTKKGWQQP